jgi:hypothetical protein
VRTEFAAAVLRLQTSLGNALIWAKGHPAPETSAAFARARELASREENASERFSAYYGLWAGHASRGEAGPAREMAELFLRETTARPDCPEAVIAHRVAGGQDGEERKLHRLHAGRHQCGGPGRVVLGAGCGCGLSIAATSTPARLIRPVSVLADPLPLHSRPGRRPVG